MKVSYQWLKELVNLNVSSLKLAEEMSLYSVEVESLEPLVKAGGLVIGHVLQKEKHPNADKLSICQVDLGTGISQIVCGAPNVAAGQKVIVALPGAKLPEFDIKVSVIRGIPSNGMICALQELGLEHKYIPTEFANGIFVLPDDAPIGMDALEYLQYNDDTIELGLTPNRMDLLSMLGVANDVNAIYDLGLKPLQYVLKETSQKTQSVIDVELQTSTCYSYYARVVENVIIQDSPQFIKARLIASGIRPINNVVDITNYVLMLFGQPLHAFDKDKIGSKIIVRRAKENETTITLDGITRTLNHRDLVITDNMTDDGRIICVAGVMGSKNSEVTPTTTHIVLESAVFRPLNIRRTSAKLNLRSEASVRYERGVDLNQSLAAVNYACFLLEKYAKGSVLSGSVHRGMHPLADKQLTLDEKYVKDCLGIKVSLKEMEHIFRRLSFKTRLIGKEITVFVPNRRLDITIKEDLVEEIARINGYDQLAETLPLMNVSGSLTKDQQIKRNLLNLFVGLGLKEVITYSLVSREANQHFHLLTEQSDEPVCLLHPISEDHSTLRFTLINSLLDVVKYHHARKMKDIAIFELGKKYHMEGDVSHESWLLAGVLNGKRAGTSWRGDTEIVDFYVVKGILDYMFAQLHVEVKYQPLTKECKELHPGRSAEINYQNKRIGYLGELHPQYIKDQDLDGGYVFEIDLDSIVLLESPISLYQPISKVPAVERDLALVMKKEQAVGDIIQAIYQADKAMIRKVTVFDIYEGENIGINQKSVAFRITLEADETLTEEVINSKMQRILKSLEFRYQITLRQ